MTKKDFTIIANRLILFIRRVNLNSYMTNELITEISVGLNERGKNFNKDKFRDYIIERV